MQPKAIPHPRCNVLGVRISAINMKEAISLTEAHLRANKRGYISVTGVHGIMEAQSDPDFRDVLNRSFITAPDGMPTVWIGRCQGHAKMSRVYGPDFMLRMCEASLASGYRHFFYGGNVGVAETLTRNLRHRYPGLQIAGTYTPPFRSLNAAEEFELAAQVKACKPHILWVGLSTPKQETFMARHVDTWKVPLMVGVGAAFNIHAGRIADAPDWMKNTGLQWLHRMCQEPSRLGRRYLINNPKFAWNIALQLSGLRNFER